MARTVRTRALVLAGAVVVLGGALSACSDASDDKHPDHRSFTLPGDTLTVDADDSALEIVAAPDNKAGSVDATRWFSGSTFAGGDASVSWRMSGDRLVLRTHCSGIVADCSSRHRIEVPRGVAVKVETDDGSVRASGFRDALNVHSSDGSVRVTDSTGSLDLRTDDGSVRADVSSRTVRVHTEDGSVGLELGVVPDLVDATSDDGSVTIGLPDTAYRVSTATDDGSVHVSVPRSADSTHKVSARTQDGKITVRTVN